MVVIITGIECKNNTDTLIPRAYKNSTIRRIIVEREVTCNEDEYNSNAECCRKCNPGEYHDMNSVRVKITTWAGEISKRHALVLWMECFILSVSFSVTECWTLRSISCARCTNIFSLQTVVVFT